MMISRGKQTKLGVKSVPVPPRPPRISHEVAQDLTSEYRHGAKTTPGRPKHSRPPVGPVCARFHYGSSKEPCPQPSGQNCLTMPSLIFIGSSHADPKIFIRVCPARAGQ
jgi:hypothetical protein